MTVEVEGANDTALKDFFKTATKLGRDEGDGAEALPRMAWAIAEAGAAISLVKDAEGKDDVQRAYEMYLKGRAQTVKHAAPVTSAKVQVSKLRQVAIAVQKPTCDFKGTMAKVRDLRDELIAAGEKCKAAYPSYVDAARAQQEQDDDLNDEQIKTSIRKPAAADPSVEKEIGAIVKRMEDLISGEKGVKYDDDEFVAAFEKVRACEATLSLMTKRALARKLAAEAGIELAEAA